MKFREMKTESGKIVLAGRDAESNEKLIEQVEKEEIVLHTKAAGSPFCNIKGKANKEDMKEAAIFCAKFSKVWKKAKIKKDVEVHYFKEKDIYKENNMNVGTFGVKKFGKIIVKKEEIEK